MILEKTPRKSLEKRRNLGNPKQNPRKTMEISPPTFYRGVLGFLACGGLYGCGAGQVSKAGAPVKRMWLFGRWGSSDETLNHPRKMMLMLVGFYRNLQQNQKLDEIGGSGSFGFLEHQDIWGVPALWQGQQLIPPAGGGDWGGVRPWKIFQSYLIFSLSICSYFFPNIFLF